MDSYDENNFPSICHSIMNQPLQDNKCKDLELQQDEKFNALLAEDHPLLEKFQQSLKEHLLRIQSQLNDDLKELNFSIKSKEQERENVGSHLYDLQQEILNQNSILDDYAQQINDTSEKRINKENNIKLLRKQYDDQITINKESKNYHKNRQMELTSLQALEMNIEKWSKEIEDEVIEAHRIVSKDNQDQKMIAEEKRKTDMFLFNLNSEVRKKEQELNLITEQIKDQTGLLDVLNNSLSDANADLEVLQKEQKRLTQAWSEVIIAINRRDKILFQAKERLTAEQEKKKSIEAAIEVTKKATAKEMEQNEKFEVFKLRIIEDLRNMSRQDDKLSNTISKLQSKIDETEALIKQTECDLKASKQEGNVLTNQYRLIQSKIDKQIQQKQKLEDEIFKFNENQITADNGCIYRMKILKDLQNQRRCIEENITVIEKQISNMIFELEKLKGINLKLNEDNEILHKIEKELNIKAEQYENEMKETKNEIQIKQKWLDIYRKKLEDAIEAAGGKEISKTELLITETEKKIQEVNKDIQKLQGNWLTQQSKLVKLTEKRSLQINEIQLIRKHTMLIEQKSLKINGILHDKMSIGQEVTREIKSILTKLDIFGGKLFKKKKSHEHDEEECHQMHLEFIEKLKNAEMTILKMEQEITDIKKEIEQLKNDVLEKHREALSWETKYKMAEEMARWRNDEKSNDSDIGHMKMEIRRMQVRYNQLKRAQHKLINDLENCVMHREKIFLTAMYHQKIDTTETVGINKNIINNEQFNSRTIKFRTNLQHKINEFKCKIKQRNNEINLNEKHLNELNIKLNDIKDDIRQKQNEYDNDKLQDKLIENEIEQGMLLKYQNLDTIVKKQHRAKRLRSLETYRILPKQKNDAQFMNDEQKQKDINENLINIIKTLLNDYPDKKFFLTRILQTLQGD